MSLQDDVAKAKTALSAVEASTSGAVDNLKTEFLKSGKAWIPLLGLVAIVLLHHYGIDATIINLTYNIVILLILLHYIGHYIVDICNTFLGIAKIKANKDAVVPALTDDADPLAPAVPAAPTLAPQIQRPPA